MIMFQIKFLQIFMMMESSIPMSIPENRTFHRSNSHSLSRKNSSIISGSFFCASSVNHPRNYGVSIPINDPCMERKLSRTRKMSENIRTIESKSNMATIPTQKEDITAKWIHMILNHIRIAEIFNFATDGV